MSAAPRLPDLSVVVPCFDERDSVLPLLDELEEVLDALRYERGLLAEILVVDDGSGDGTAAILEEAKPRHPRLGVLRHRTNLGQSAALATGLAAARGGVLMTLDGDGQNDPADLPRLLDALATSDMACGVRRDRHDGCLRRISSRIGNRFRDLVTGDHVQDAGCAARAFRAEVVAELPAFDGMHRFLATLARARGFRVVEIDVHHRPRRAGRSKYGIRNRALRGVFDCLGIRWWRRRAFPATSARLAPSRPRSLLASVGPERIPG